MSTQRTHTPEWSETTRLVRYDACPGDPYRPTATPLYQTATFAPDDVMARATEGGPADAPLGPYDYTRSGNPTRSVLEARLADLERGTRGFAFASGMAAIAACLRFLRAGDRLLVGDDLYGGTYRWLTHAVAPTGVEVARVDTRDLDAVQKAAAAPGAATRAVWIETPSNPRQESTDIAAVAAIAHLHGARLYVDNTMLSPILQRPLEVGADVVVHSATKWLGGHGDLTAGAVVVRDPAIADEVAFTQNAEGTALAPFEAWLLLRGLKTLGLRIERQQSTADRVAEFLRDHSAVTEVFRAGEGDARSVAIHKRQARGAGAVLAFRTGCAPTSEAIVAACGLFSTTVSFGSLHSTIGIPGRMSHASIPEAERSRHGVPADLVRLSVGIEDPADVIEDLARAFEACSGLSARRSSCDTTSLSS